MVAFWGCEVTETKAAVVNVPEAFVLNVVNATCGASSLEVQVALGLETQQLDGKAWKGAVAHLGAKQPLQVKLDLVFGHKVKFYLAKGSVSGYFQPGPSVDLVEEEAIIPSQAPKKSKKRAREEKKEAQKAGTSDSEEVSEEKAKASKPSITSNANKEVKKPKQSETPATTSSNPVNSTGTAQKKKRKKNKNKKQAANGAVN
ncbi:5'-AMP-activated protein kinase subunit gamma [Phytophthora nicotianae]|uniref:5'-AMP-activated protein kinase subunit gamma n=1 Tax=Phytophthora nicotianae TaxID=4792 RepID=A0A0W8CZY7_PHYNI|nr:5'-AMP-activated protein kinase subunit gamma [Phytophthora nicotianae]